jgi:hypothetical protein
VSFHAQLPRRLRYIGPGANRTWSPTYILVGLQGGWSCERKASGIESCVFLDSQAISLAKLGVGGRSRGVEFGIPVVAGWVTWSLGDSVVMVGSFCEQTGIAVTAVVGG